MENILLNKRDDKFKWMISMLRKDNQTLAKECSGNLTAYMNGEGGEYFLFSYLYGQVLSLNLGGSSFFNSYKNYDSFDKLTQLSAPSQIQNFIFNGKNFKMTNPVWELLKNTKNKVFIRNHPFQTFSIDQKINTKIEGLNIIFTIFQEVVSKDLEVIGCNYLSIGRDERDDSEFWISGTIKEGIPNPENSSFSNEEFKELTESINQLYSNFIDYLNHPYSNQTIYKLSSNNEKRVKRGQFPRQDRYVIDIKKEFINTILTNKNQEDNTRYNSKFWVRGHFKHFRNKKRFNRLYNLDEEQRKKEGLFINGKLISKWILPYIKGNGTLIEKNRRAN